MMLAQYFIQITVEHLTQTMKKLLIIISIVQGLLVGCSLHKLDVQQGNIVTPEMLTQLEIGMTQERVRFLLGSPPITDPFNADRWDYTYTYREENKQTETSHLTLRFDDENKLSTIDKSGYIPPKERSGNVE